MSKLQQELTVALGKARSRRNVTRDLLVARRVSRHAPEVMVKVTGYSHGRGALLAHLRYISRHGRLEAETSYGERLQDCEGLGEIAEEWTDDLIGARTARTRDACKIMLSMPAGTLPDAVLGASRTFAVREFGDNHPWVMVLHTDRDHPHCHLVVRMLGHDGRRLNPRKADLARWRTTFAEAMHEQGFDAEATPRSTRGIVRKCERLIFRHMLQPEDGRLPRIPQALAARIQECADEVINGKAGAYRPWEAAIQERQSAVRSAWLNVANEVGGEIAPVRLARSAHLSEATHGRQQGESRITALLHSKRHPATDRAGRPPFPVAGMHELPGRDVVPRRDAPEVLLRSDARHRVGRGDAAGDALRRAGADGGTRARLAAPVRLQDVLMQGQRLAGELRRMVQAMPPVRTLRDQIRVHLLSKAEASAPDPYSSKQERDQTR